MTLRPCPRCHAPCPTDAHRCPACLVVTADQAPARPLPLPLPLALMGLALVGCMGTCSPEPAPIESLYGLPPIDTERPEPANDTAAAPPPEREG